MTMWRKVVLGCLLLCAAACGGTVEMEHTGAGGGAACPAVGSGDDAPCTPSAPLDGGVRAHPTVGADAATSLGRPDAIPADAYFVQPLPSTAACVVVSGTGTCAGGPPLESCSCESLATCGFACGGGDAPDAGPSISCAQASACSVGCDDDCGVDCTQANDCEVTAGENARVGCGQSPVCVGSVGDDSTVVCTQAGTCAFSVGAGGTVTCTQASDCDVVVGAGTHVDCTQAERCDVTCAGSCGVNCTQASGCSVTCPVGAACTVECVPEAPTSCPDGRTQVCGASRCPG